MKEIEISKAAKRAPRGEQTRQEILETAVDIASAEGLEGLTIGRLAQELSMSKSGLFAHFGSKEELQIATIQTARDIFVREIVDPVSEIEKGIVRLQAMLEKWLSYVERRIFKGGCFFAAAAAEFDSRPGAIRDLVVKLSKSWLHMIEGEARQAQQVDQIDNELDATQLAFELHSLAHGANWAYQLFGDKRAFVRAREAINNRLQESATAAGLRLLQSGAGKPRKAAAKRVK
jgi:AcrR family transcriptional regulator